MYIASLFNQAGLFQHVGQWHSNSPYEEQRKVEEFLFRATSAYLHLLRMEALRDSCVRQYHQHKGELIGGNKRIVFWSPALVELINEVSPFISAVRIMQDMIVPLAAVGQKIKASVAFSLSDAINQLGKYGFQEEIRSAITAYWSKSGVDLRAYRHLDQHYYAIVEHSLLETEPEEKILVYLPDNPEARKHSDVTFALERNALPFCRGSFTELHNLIEDIAAKLGYPAGKVNQSFRMEQLGILKESGKRTLAVVLQNVANYPGIEFMQMEDRSIAMRALPSTSTGQIVKDR